MRPFGLVCLLCLGCASLSPQRRAELEAEAQPAVAALQAGQFDDALKLAREAKEKSGNNSRADAVLAVALYRLAMHDLVSDAVTFASSVVASGLMRGDFLNRDYLDFAVKRAEERLAEVDSALARASEDPDVSLELCLACWEVDWNRNGLVDERDRRLLEIEKDANGAELPRNDPRRRPTFRFDRADTLWLRALVHFQRAVLALIDGYDPGNLSALIRGHAETFILKLRNPKSVTRARLLILSGLELARNCRKAVLAETDDDREWLPSPKQQSHPMPLAVDQALFDTWAGVLDDVEALLNSREGLSLAQLAPLGHHSWRTPPVGSLDVGQLLRAPADIVVPIAELEKADWRKDPRVLEELLKKIFGPALLPSMPDSPLFQRLNRMRHELDKSEDTLERKLRYLLWLN